MKWQALPGPANFIAGVLQQLRDGNSVAVATPLVAPQGLEDAFIEPLEHDRWRPQRVTVDAPGDPLQWLTEKLYIEPKQWAGWSVERMFGSLSPEQVIVIDGVTESNWDAWRSFLRDFETASRQRASDERAVLLVFVRGVPRKRLQISGAALSMHIWSGVLGELDTLIYVDQRLRSNGKRARYHKLIVRQIAALALWDLDLADFLVDQPERSIFDSLTVLKLGRTALGRDDASIIASWEAGGMDNVDGVELSHPFVLVDNADADGELQRRLWAAQAAELFPLIEVRRRELVAELERHVPCPFWIDGTRKITSLEELEIGTLAHVAQTHGIRDDLRERTVWLARCRNALAHLRLLDDADALSARLHS